VAGNDQGAGSEATVEESEDFLSACETTRGRALTDAEREHAWAAALWNRSFDGKEQVATEGHPQSLTETEARERSRRVRRA
jgi:hypothetical protein